MKRKLFFLSRFIISAVMLGLLWFFLRDNYQQLKSALKSADLLILLGGFSLFTFNIFVLALRLNLVLSTQQLKLSLVESIKLNFVGFFYNSILPTAVGGDIARAYYVSEKFPHKKVESCVSVFADRTIGLFTILAIAVCAVALAPQDYIQTQTKIWIYVICVSVLFFIIFALNEKFASRFKFLIWLAKKIKIEAAARRAYNVLNNFRHHKKTGFAVCILSLGGQLLTISVAYIISLGLKLDIPYSIFLLYMPLVSAASMIPSLGGTGPREGAFILLFGPLVGKMDAAAIAVCWLAFFLSLSLIGGIVYLLSGYHRLSMSEIQREMDYDRQILT